MTSVISVASSLSSSISPAMSWDAFRTVRRSSSSGYPVGGCTCVPGWSANDAAANRQVREALGEMLSFGTRPPFQVQAVGFAQQRAGKAVVDRGQTQKRA